MELIFLNYHKFENLIFLYKVRKYQIEKDSNPLSFTCNLKVHYKIVLLYLRIRDFLYASQCIYSDLLSLVMLFESANRDVPSSSLSGYPGLS